MKQPETLDHKGFAKEALGSSGAIVTLKVKIMDDSENG